MWRVSPISLLLNVWALMVNKEFTPKVMVVIQDVQESWILKVYLDWKPEMMDMMEGLDSQVLAEREVKVKTLIENMMVDMNSICLVNILVQQMRNMWITRRMKMMLTVLVMMELMAYMEIIVDLFHLLCLIKSNCMINIIISTLPKLYNFLSNWFVSHL